MIRKLHDNEIKNFIDFGDNLYKDDNNYVPYIYSDLKKTIKKLVFEDKKYVAVCSFDENNNINGRVLLTVGKNKQLKTDNCGYFSHIEVINDQNVFNELMDYSCDLLKEMGAEYILGSFFPFDPDNRRGILIEGFEYEPMIFTSHNYSYYKELFETYGFKKLTDAYEYEYKYISNSESVKKIKEKAEKAIADNDIVINKLDYKNINKDIEDVHTIMEMASTEINFEEVLSVEEISKIFKSWKSFIDPDFALIARRKKDLYPIGFTLSIPNYYEVIRKMKGRLNLRGLIIFVLYKNKIKSLRGILQYVIPEYQHKGVSKALYYENMKSVNKHNINRVSLGTILEANDKSNGAIVSLGGKLSRIYRIYYKKIK